MSWLVTGPPIELLMLDTAEDKGGRTAI